MNSRFATTSSTARLTWRSEAFAEDLSEAPTAASELPAHDAGSSQPRWSLTLVPLLVAIVGMAFAVVPSLS